MIKRITILIFLFLVTITVLLADVTENEFYNALNSSTNNEIVFDSTTTAVHYFTRSDSIHMSTSGLTLTLNFDLSSTVATELHIENLKLSGYNKVIFNINRKTKIVLDNCKFKLKYGVLFNFNDREYLYPANLEETQISIENCDFIWDETLYTGLNAKQLYFEVESGIANSGDYRLRNVIIDSCNFEYTNTTNSLTQWLNAITFFRANENVSFSNITISNNSITYAGIDRARTRAIAIFNIDGSADASDFIDESASNHYYNINHDINILNNYLETDSECPEQAVFVQGPYKDVNVNGNEMYGFGRFMPDNPSSPTKYYNSFPVCMYGARSYDDYSDNVNNVEIKNNILTTISSGIIANSSNICVDSNEVRFLPLTNYWENVQTIPITRNRVAISVRTGDELHPEQQIENMNIRCNEIYCNEISGATGIMVTGKDFNVSHNTIFGPNSWGIMYWGNGGNINQGIGSSSICNNSVDFGNQAYNVLNNNSEGFDYFLDNNFLTFSGINFYRSSHTPIIPYSNEILTISDNAVYCDGTIDPVVFFNSSTNPQITCNITNNISGVLPYDTSTTQLNASYIHDELETTGDVDGDGLSDMIYIYRYNTTLYVLTKFNNGDGTWTDVNVSTPYGTIVDSYPINTGDFNGDGKMDIVFTYYSSSRVYISMLLSDGDGTWTRYYKYYTGYGSEIFDGSIVIGDASNDGCDDIIFIYSYMGDFSIATTVSRTSGGTWSKYEEMIMDAPDPEVYDAIPGDFNGDGDIDFAFAHDHNSKLNITLFTSNGDRTWSWTYHEFSSYGSYAYGDRLVVGDVSGDGWDDLVFIYRLSGELKILSIWKASTGWGSCLQTHTDGTNVDVNPVLSGDFNGDDLLDFAFWGYDWSENGLNVRWRNSNGDGTWGALYQIFPNDPEVSYVPYAANFDSDDRADILFTYQNSSNMMNYNLKTSSAMVASFSKRLSNESEETHIAKSYELSQNYPNPFNPSTTIRYSLKENGKVKLSVFNLQGRKVAQLVNAAQSMGTYELTWDASSLPSGIYIYRLQAGEFVDTKKMTLLK